MIRIHHGFEEQIHQGDIIRNVEYIQTIDPLDNYKFKITFIEFPLIIVLTQECDLDLDYKARKGLLEKNPQDKLLMSVIVSPLYNAEQVFIGKHLEELDNRQMQNMNGKLKNPIKNNENPRYYFFNFPAEENINNLVIDFKHYFSVEVGTLEKLKKTNFEFGVNELYREDISQRFVSYLARIKLPHGCNMDINKKS